MLEHLYEYPLGPLIEIRISCVYLPVPVIESVDLLDLPLDVFNVFSSGNSRMHMVFDGIVLSREPEGVPAHRVYYVLPLNKLISAPRVRDDISPPVSYMQAVS